MRNEKRIAELIYGELKKENIESISPLISRELEEEKTGKLGFTKTPFLNSIGRELGKLLIKENWKFERLTWLWKEGGRDERLIVISALEKLSEKDYESSKQFVLNVLEDISDWEICDQLALRVTVNLAVRDQKEMFSLMHKWIKSKNEWVRRLAVATIPPYIRRKPVESRTCLELLGEAMKEENKGVKKAVGWALREVAKKDPKSVYDFLQKWAKGR